MPATAGLLAGVAQLAVYNNTALHGAPLRTQHVGGASAISFSHASATPFSAEVTGTLTFGRSANYTFDCDFGLPHAGSVAFAWIDGHQVCNDSPYSVGGLDHTLPIGTALGQKTKGVRVRLWVNPGAAAGGAAAKNTTVTLRWTADGAGASGPALSPVLPEAERRRDELQGAMMRGWGTWNHGNTLSVVSLPSAATVTAMVCELSSGSCLYRTVVEGRADQTGEDVSTRVGPHAYDHSYVQAYYSPGSSQKPEPPRDQFTNKFNASIEFGGGQGGELLGSVTLQHPCKGTDAAGVAGVNCSDLVVVLASRFSWSRAGTVAKHTATNSLEMTPYGLPTLSVSPASDSVHSAIPSPSSGLVGNNLTQICSGNFTGGGCVAFSLASGVATFSTTAQSTAATVAAIAKRRQAELAVYAMYSPKAETFEATQAAATWNLIYTPSELGPMMPVSRSWTNDVGAPVLLWQDDWGYDMFGWDCIFGSYLASAGSRNVSYSALIQVIKSKTENGFIPNGATAGGKSQDRTEPMMGAKVLLEMYRKFGDVWLVELLFDDLLDWNNWSLRERTMEPLDLIVPTPPSIFTGSFAFAHDETQRLHNLVLVYL